MNMSELTQHDLIVQAYNQYLIEHATFEEKGVKAAATRARTALGDLGKLTKERRKEIIEKKKAM
jgi:N-glycosylase/DNA lyase